MRRRFLGIRERRLASPHSRRFAFAYLPFIFIFSFPAFAQTQTVVAGVVADSSIAAPVVAWNRIAPQGDMLTLTLNGWTLGAERTHRIAPRARLATSLSLTPLHAHGSDRVYIAGERNRQLEFDDAAVEATFGRIDVIGERWTSDVRVVALYEHVTGSPNDDFWSSPYAGLRTRQAYRRITAEDPLLMTFDGHEVSGEAEVFAGKHVWSRVRLHQRASVRRGRIRVGESAVAFYGSSINPVNAFLAGASWPAGDVHPLYGYRYAELRLDRGAGVTGDVSYAVRDSITVGAHASILRSHSIEARGIAADVSVAFKGIGMRLGVAKPREGDMVVYGSILVATFLR